MFLSRKEIVKIKLKKLCNAIIGGFLLALPLLLVLLLWGLGF
jgi:hypothetical protein